MSIQKKSLINTLQTSKKANVAAENKGEKQVSAKNSMHLKGVGNQNAKGVGHFKGVPGVSARSLRSMRKASFRVM